MLVNRVSGLLVLSAMLTSVTALAAPPTKEQCIAANEAVQYLREAHKLREAREKLLLCVSDACPAPVREDCAQRLDEVAKATPSIVFDVKDSAGNDVGDVKVTTDGQPLAGNAGAAVELDPGEHTFVFEAAGLAKLEKKFVVVEGVKGRREVIRLGSAKPTEAATPASAPLAEEVSSRSSGPPILAWAAFGVGGAGLVLGITAGLVAGGKHSTLAGECDNAAGTCAPQYAGDLDAFHTWRTVSTMSYVIGALGVAGGAVLWLTAPKAPSSSTAHVWLAPAAAGVAGWF
ncbi:MAG: hypothetical protein ACLP1X_09345 [Polyangiaceae bacterium]